MASAPDSTQLPLFYKEVVPLTVKQHGTWSARRTDQAPWLVNQHVVPLTVEEFPMAQRHFPIVFSSNGTSVPLALMGMNAGINVFVEDDGTLRENIYMPAYARRYPFLLAKTRPDTDELSLCVDPTSELVGEYDDGSALFDGEAPSEECKNTLKFCEQFEIAGNKSTAFVEELEKHELLIDGELSVKPTGAEKPFAYRGFRMVDDKKLRDLRGDQLRAWSQNGMLPLIYAHIFSLELVRDIFGKQAALGKIPAPEAAA